MENFNWESFTRKIAIKAPLADLYHAWTCSNEIEKWFLSKARFYNRSWELLPKEENIAPNNTYEWSWYLYDIVDKGKITKANGKDLVEFTFAGDCLVEVKFTQNKDDVIVELTQSNIPTDDQSKQNIRIGCDKGWSFFLLNLKSVYEGGMDLRNKNEDLKGMLNN